MKYLISTTALALVLATPAMAQTAVEQHGEAGQVQATEQIHEQGFIPGFEAGDILANELIGQDVYAHSLDAQPAGPAAQQPPAAQDPAAQQTQTSATQSPATAQQPATGARWQAMQSSDIQNMDNIGQVSDVVISQDGQVRAVIVGVGGFLGIGERDVALTLDQVSFAVDQDDASQVYLIANVNAEQIENAPEFDRTALDENRQRVMTGDGQAAAPAHGDGTTAQTGTEAWRGDREMFAAPDMDREGYERAEAGEVSVDSLLGSNVYDINDENIGSVDDVVVNGDGSVQYVVLDVGGFLGLGTHTVAVGLDELTVLHDDGWSDLRVYIEATQEQLEAMPEHAAN